MLTTTPQYLSGQSSFKCSVDYCICPPTFATELLSSSSGTPLHDKEGLLRLHYGMASLIANASPQSGLQG